MEAFSKLSSLLMNALETVSQTSRLAKVSSGSFSSVKHCHGVTSEDRDVRRRTDSLMSEDRNQVVQQLESRDVV